MLFHRKGQSEAFEEHCDLMFSSHLLMHMLTFQARNYKATKVEYNNDLFIFFQLRMNSFCNWLKFSSPLFIPFKAQALPLTWINRTNI